MISFTTTTEDSDLIDLIVQRATKPGACYPLPLSMDITACHANGCPLNLEALLEAPDQDFYHDLTGIVVHINRKTGKLEDCFLPRYSRRDK